MLSLTQQSQMNAFLRGVSYPAPKPDLIDVAADNGATRELIATLQDLPDGDYYCLPDVIQELEELDPESEEPADTGTEEDTE